MNIQLLNLIIDKQFVLVKAKLQYLMEILVKYVRKNQPL